MEQPFENDPDCGKQITVKILKEMLDKLPSEFDDYEVKYDSALGRICKGEFTIYKESKEISING